MINQSLPALIWGIYIISQVAAEPVQKLFQDGSLSTNQGTDTEYQLLEGAKAGDMELVKKICSGKDFDELRR